MDAHSRKKKTVAEATRAWRVECRKHHSLLLAKMELFYEKGKSIMSVELLAKVCILYDISMDYLLNGCESENNVIIPEIMISLEKYNVEQQKHM